LRFRVGVVVLWTIAVLILFDAVAGIVFRPPADPRMPMSSMQLYFDYGRSIEGKLRREVGASSAQDTLIVGAGWIANVCNGDSPVSSDKLVFDMYGMSFTNRIGKRLLELDPALTMSGYGGPSAPINHSYACFLRRFNAQAHLAPVQILGVLASSVPRMLTLSGLTTSFEAIQPFTYPRYSLTTDGRLVAFSPSITSPDELRQALADPPKWRRFVDELAAHDYFYDRFVFRSDVFDHSVLGRMVRRAWGQRIERARLAELRPAEGFAGSPEIAPVLRAILTDLANKVRSVHALPIVILMEDRGFGGSLSAAVPALKADNIPFVLTSDLVSPGASENFLSDGHFAPAANDKIAKAVLTLLRRDRATR
jgi:hypothetical protein